MEGKLKQDNINMNHTLLFTLGFLFIYQLDLLIIQSVYVTSDM